MNAKQELERLLDDTAAELGGIVNRNKAEVAAYMEERALHLATIPSTEPGYAQAVKREAQNVAMFAGLSTDAAAQEVDRQWFTVIATGIRVLAVALA